MNIEVIRQADDLSRHVWRFGFHVDWSRGELRLVEWRPEERASKRHKWRQAGNGYAFRPHDSHHSYGMQTPAAAVPFPQDVQSEALEAALDHIKLVGPADPKEAK